MINYYEELKLDPSMSCEELCVALHVEKKNWIHKQNANNLKKRQEAERRISLIEEAAMIFSDKLKREQYDLDLLKAQRRAGTRAQQQTEQQYYQQHSQSSSQRTEARQASVPDEQSSQESESTKEKFDPQAERKYFDEPIEKVIMTASSLYEAGNLDKAIEYCNLKISQGANNPDLYDYLGLSYWENGETQSALGVYEYAIKQFPNVPCLYGNAGAIYLQVVGNYDKSREYLNRALELDPGNRYYLGLDILYMFFVGQVNEAETKIQHYLSENPDDALYRQQVAEAYISYSDKFFVKCQNGGSYIPDEQAYGSILYYRNKAKSILPNERTEKLFDEIEQKGQKSFDKDNLKGLGFFSIVALLLFGRYVLLWIIISAVLAYYSYCPQWMIEKTNLTNDRGLANTITHYMYVAFSSWIHICHKIFKIIFRIPQ